VLKFNLCYLRLRVRGEYLVDMIDNKSFEEILAEKEFCKYLLFYSGYEVMRGAPRSCSIVSFCHWGILKDTKYYKPLSGGLQEVCLITTRKVAGRSDTITLRFS